MAGCLGWTIVVLVLVVVRILERLICGERYSGRFLGAATLRWASVPRQACSGVNGPPQALGNARSKDKLARMMVQVFMLDLPSKYGASVSCA